MANPKYKTSRSKTRRRRANISLSLPTISICPNCKKPTQPHRICASCGYYKGRNILKSEEKEKK